VAGARGAATDRFPINSCSELPIAAKGLAARSLSGSRHGGDVSPARWHRARWGEDRGRDLGGPAPGNGVGRQSGARLWSLPRRLAAPRVGGQAEGFGWGGGWRELPVRRQLETATRWACEWGGCSAFLLLLFLPGPRAGLFLGPKPTLSLAPW